MDVKVYLGRFGEEQLLFDPEEVGTFILDITPRKGDFIFYNTTTYKVLYCMNDVDNDEYAIFVRQAVEEDY